MPTIRLTKSFVLKAIQTEPISSFKAGSWVSIQGKRATWAGDAPMSDPTCKVCAVGAVIRHAVDAHTLSKQVYGIADHVTQGIEIRRHVPRVVREYLNLATDADLYFSELDPEVVIKALWSNAKRLVADHPLNALSILFEGLSDYYIPSGQPIDADPAPESRRAIHDTLLAFVAAEFPESFDVEVPYDDVVLSPGVEVDPTRF